MIENLEQRDSQESSFIQINTNEVLVEEKKERTTYYLPCYVRMKVKNVKEFQVESLSGSISATLLFGFYHGNLPSEIMEQFTGEGSKSIIIQLPRQSCLELRQSNEVTVKIDNVNKIVDYVVRTQFECNLTGDVFLTPFEIFNLFLTVTVQTIVLDPKLNNGKNIHIKFNCMSSEKVSSVDSGQDCDYGTYTLASYFLDCDYSNSASHRFRPISVIDSENKIEKKESKKKKKKEKKEKKQSAKDLFKGVQEHESGIKMITSPPENKSRPKIEIKGNCNWNEKKKEEKLKNFQYTHFRIPLYKHPISSLIGIFIPVWVLAAINLGIYYQDSNVLADKIASIATVMLALVAFIPTINEKIPETKMIKLVEIILYLQIGTTFLTLLDSLSVRAISATEYETDLKTNAYFLITMIINVVCFFIVIGLVTVHKLWWENVYTREKADKKTGKLVRDMWENKQCDQEFKKWIVSNKIVPMTQHFQKIKIAPEREQQI